MSLDFGLVWDDGLAGVGAEEQWDQVSSGVPPGIRRVWTCCSHYTKILRGLGQLCYGDRMRDL